MAFLLTGELAQKNRRGRSFIIPQFLFFASEGFVRFVGHSAAEDLHSAAFCFLSLKESVQLRADASAVLGLILASCIRAGSILPAARARKRPIVPIGLGARMRTGRVPKAWRIKQGCLVFGGCL